MIHRFYSKNFHSICEQLCSKDKALREIICKYGYPPMWTRPNTFETLVHIILEQQVSLASALATLNKLREKINEITPHNILSLTDAELRDCYFSRQKTTYARGLANELLNEKLDLNAFEKMPDEEIRVRLTSIKGIGNWTVDVYLMFVLQRSDVFPIGDLAAVNALKRIKELPKETTREQVIKIASRWKPNRTIATMILWHYYLSTPKKHF